MSENYRSSEAALKELVDNAWDADAETVRISLPKPMASESIVIDDDGTGMTDEELTREYLLIASDRTQRRGQFTAGKHRKAKGRKGIGKFAGLMAAHTMRLETWARGRKAVFSLSAADFEAADDIERLAIEVVAQPSDERAHGTVITLTDLNQGLSFPDPDRLRQLLIQDYGREDGFRILVDGKPLDVDDIQGAFGEHQADLDAVGPVRLRFAISDGKRGLRRPGISIRVGGKVVGKPDFFGLDEADDFPRKLLSKLYGEIEADGLADHVTADWGALIENSELKATVRRFVEPILREKFREEYVRDINLAQARLQRGINERLAALPEHKRDFADRAIKKILGKYYGEPESKVESMVSVLLEAVERTDYRAILEHLHETRSSDIARLAESLSEFGLAELAVIAEQTSTRLQMLDRLEALCRDPNALEKQVHEALESNLWVFGLNYAFFSSNKTLKRQIKDLLGKQYTGDRADRRPDLLLTLNYDNAFLLIEFKRPGHALTFADYQQATAYRNDLKPYVNADMRIIIIGGSKGASVGDQRDWERNTEMLVYDQLIAHARNQLYWLLKELGGIKRR
ncbi:ATP-binding protein [Thiocapsa rosea]|uniref:ATP-binding protein n=1 Tax=Thiocapsa rosea TaxID=69360 RepID=UPI00248274C8|nr:ATP-binding protein [Thiocapsa rosea]